MNPVIKVCKQFTEETKTHKKGMQEVSLELLHTSRNLGEFANEEADYCVNLLPIKARAAVTLELLDDKENREKVDDATFETTVSPEAFTCDDLKHAEAQDVSLFLYHYIRIDLVRTVTKDLENYETFLVAWQTFFSTQPTNSAYNLIINHINNALATIAQVLGKED